MIYKYCLVGVQFILIYLNTNPHLYDAVLLYKLKAKFILNNVAEMGDNLYFDNISNCI